MAKYIVTYDLNKVGQDYSNLIKAIKAYPCSHPMESTWFVKANVTATDLYNDLSRFIDRNDSIFISEVSATNRNGWLNQSDWDFLNS
jgi:hypothetical protein